MQAESQKIDHLKKKIGRKSKIFSRFFRSFEKNRPKNSVIFKMAEQSPQMGGYNPPKKGYKPPYNPPEKRFELLS